MGESTSTINYQPDNKRVAKNTILLYIRMFIMMLISLYTSRKILEVLGENDFGIYNVVAGVIVLFSFLTTAMTNSTQRYLNYYMGVGNEEQLNKTFNIAMIAHISIVVIILVLSETIGLWFVINKLNIPPDRHVAMMWVYQMSVLATVFSVIMTPYRASFIATEKMDYYAYLSVIDCVCKLLIVLVLPFFCLDRLILYSILFAAVSFFIFILYLIFGNIKMPFTRFHRVWDKKYFYEMLSFTSWYLVGGGAMVAGRQGINILLNIFYNVAVNAAVGVANQVRGAVVAFVSNFQTAFNPQIVKLYASNQYDEMIRFIYKSSKLSYYLSLIVCLPIVICCNEILSLWLVDVPAYSVEFTRLVVISVVFDIMSTPLMTAIGATGQIAKYQIYVSLILISVLPISYVALKLGCSPAMVFVIDLIINIIAYYYRLLYIKKFIRYRLSEYYSEVIVKVLLVTVLSIPIPVLLYYLGVSYLLIIPISLLTSVLIISTCGLSASERNFAFSLIKNKFKK